MYDYTMLDEYSLRFLRIALAVIKEVNNDSSISSKEKEELINQFITDIGSKGRGGKSGGKLIKYSNKTDSRKNNE